MCFRHIELFKLNRRKLLFGPAFFFLLFTGSLPLLEEGDTVIFS